MAEADLNTLVLESDEAVQVYPVSRLPDMAHDWEECEALAAKFVEANGSVDADCYLCQEGCCVRRHFYFADSGHLVVHGAYEA